MNEGVATSTEKMRESSWRDFNKEKDTKDAVSFIQNIILSKDGIPADRLTRFKAKIGFAFHFARKQSILHSNTAIIWLTRDSNGEMQGLANLSEEMHLGTSKHPVRLSVDWMCIAPHLRQSIASKSRLDFLKRIDDYCKERPDIYEIVFNTSVRNSELIKLYSSIAQRKFDPLDGQLSPIAKFVLPLKDISGNQISVLEAIRSARAKAKEKSV